MKPRKEKNRFTKQQEGRGLLKRSFSPLYYSHLLVCIDQFLTEQVNSILHHPTFQKLEASWRGLHYLLQYETGASYVKIRILDLAWNELAYDLHNAIEFDQSYLFKKIYTNEFDQPGGEPFGLIICDHYVRLNPRPGETSMDIQTLFSLSGVAAAAFSPCILSVDPEFFGLDQFSEFETLRDLKKIFTQTDYISWKTLRKHVDSRFLGLVLPRMSLRHPYQLGDQRNGCFCFKEVCTKTEDYLWGNAAYGFASVVLRSFCQTNWFLNIKGISHEDNLLGGGILEDLPVHYYRADASTFYAKPSLETSLKADQEKSLSDLGFIALSCCQYTSACAFYSCQTIYLPDLAFKKSDPLDVELSYYTMHNILSVSRFAHYLKIIGRNKIGSFITASQYQSFLQNWIVKYTGQSSGDITNDFIAKYPLAESNISVREGSPDSQHFLCVLAIRPHVYMRELKGALQLVMKLPTISSTGGNRAF